MKGLSSSRFPLYLENNSKNSSKLICGSSLIILRKSPLGISLFPCTGTVLPSHLLFSI